jgi:hypothetical protein
MSIGDGFEEVEVFILQTLRPGLRANQMGRPDAYSRAP